MNTHVLIAITPEGERLEIGRVGSAEKAAALKTRLQGELGDEYVGFEVVELDVQREFLENAASSASKSCTSVRPDSAPNPSCR